MPSGVILSFSIRKINFQTRLGSDLTTYTSASPLPVRRDKDADAPKWRTCKHCGELFPAWRRVHVKRTCPGYSQLWAGDVRMKLYGALDAYANMMPGNEPSVVMTTISAPGVDGGLPWDERNCWPLGEHVHSGKLGCRVLPESAEKWNKRAPEEWRTMNKRTRWALEKNGVPRPWMLVRFWEYQKRGVLHAHVVLAYTRAVEREAADAYVRSLSWHAPRHGFGFVDRKPDVTDGLAAARYLSGYLGHGKNGKMQLFDTVLQSDVPRSLVYVSPELSRASGLDMETLRLRRYLFHKIGADGLKLAKYMGLDLEQAYILVKDGWWGRTVSNFLLEDELSLT